MPLHSYTEYTNILFGKTHSSSSSYLNLNLNHTHTLTHWYTRLNTHTYNLLFWIWISNYNTHIHLFNSFLSKLCVANSPYDTSMTHTQSYTHLSPSYKFEFEIQMTTHSHTHTHLDPSSPSFTLPTNFPYTSLLHTFLHSQDITSTNPSHLQWLVF